MAETSSARSPCFDPYGQYRFRLLRAGRTILGAASSTGFPSRLQSLRPPNLDAATAQECTRQRITLERAVTEDFEFQTWAKSSLVSLSDDQFHPLPSPAELSLHIVDERGNVAQCYRLHGCKITEFKSLPDINPRSSTLAIERVTLAVERCQLEL